MRPTFTAVMALSLLAVLTGCRVRVDTAVVVDSDGSATLSIAYGIDEETRARLGEAAEPLAAEAAATLPPGVRVEAVEVDGLRGERLEVEVADPAELVDALGGPTVADVAVDEEGARLRLDLEDLAAQATGDLLPAAVDAGEVDARVRFMVRLPHRVTEHNADRTLPDGSLVWELLPPRRRTAMARSEAGRGGRTPAVALVVTLLGVAGGAALGLRHRRSAR